MAVVTGDFKLGYQAALLTILMEAEKEQFRVQLPLVKSVVRNVHERFKEDSQHS